MRSNAIVLNVVKYNDEHFIANLLTEQQGCVGMLVRISRAKRTAVRHALFQPLAVLSVEWQERPRAELQRPTAANTLLNLSTVPYDPYKGAMALFLAEFLYHAVKSEPDHQSIFTYVLRSIEWLDACETGFASFHLMFLLRLTRFLGFMPNVETAQPGYYFDLRSSDFTAEQPLHPDFLEPRDAALVPLLMRMRYDNMRFFKFSGADRSRMLEYINLYYRLHLPNFPELKSLAVLKELFRA